MTRRKPPREEGDLLLKNFSRRLRDQFKAYCAERGLSMKDALTQYMRACVKGDVSGPRPGRPDPDGRNDDAAS